MNRGSGGSKSRTEPLRPLLECPPEPERLIHRTYKRKREESSMEVERVGIVGCGLMGRGIAEICSRAGIPVTVREINQEVLDAGLGAVDLGEMLEKLVDVFSQARCFGKSVLFLDHYASKGKD